MTTDRIAVDPAGPSTELADVSPTSAQGLDEAEAKRRLKQGQGNRVKLPSSRSGLAILRSNLLTRFNALLGSLCVIVLVIGPVQDALFGLVLVANTAIGVVAEVRAKRTLDRFRVLTVTRAKVIREGRDHELSVDDVVQGDLVDAGPGDQVVADGVVVSAYGAETDESLLTGEAQPVHKSRGEEVLSGSFVVAGTLRYQATKVGIDAYANALAQRAREATTPPSEVKSGIDRFLRWVTWSIVPAALILLVTQVGPRGTKDALRSSIAAVVALVPEGLVLLVSVAFALAVVRLGRRRVVVQQLPAVETLARVDVVCIDKTGTLTEGQRLRVHSIEPLDSSGGMAAVSDALGALAAADPSPNTSLRAIAAAARRPEGWAAQSTVPFSSGRRWSGADFGDRGTWVLGAPETLLPVSSALQPREVRDIEERVNAQADLGRRVVLMATAGAMATATNAVGSGAKSLSNRELPTDLQPCALVLLEDVVRPEAAATVRYFASQGVAIKVLSGDHPRTAAAIARQVGIDHTSEPIDASSMAADPSEIRAIVEQHGVLGRVSPQQKQQIVDVLQDAGHSIAMVGDGVNDVPALKSADLAVAMGSGSQAARAVAELVLLDDDFGALPHVVREGRRVVSNMERVAKLFITKSVYAFLLVVAVGMAQLPFPFIPRQLTLVGSLTIGIPATLLALGGDAPRAEPGFLKRALRFGVPAGIAAATATFAAYALARTAKGVTLEQARTTATMALVAVGLALLSQAAAPLTTKRRLLVVSMGLAYVLVLAIPATRHFFALDSPPWIVVLAAAGAAALGIWGLRLLTVALPNLLRRRGEPPAARGAQALQELLDQGESSALEFKATLRWDLREHQVNKALERVVVKTAAGFLNARGGTLLLGVDDAGGVRGLADDYATLTRPDRDGFERHLMQLLTSALGGQVQRFLAVDFSEVNGLDVCALSIRAADRPIYLREGTEPRLYVRSGNATTPLPVDEAVAYVGSRWLGQSTGHILEALVGRHR